MEPHEIVELLGLAPHPEGGSFVETWRGRDRGGRACGTAIYFLLTEGERSHWHRIDATEIWHFYAGDPLELSVSPDGHELESVVLGPDLTTGQRPQRIVPAGAWQAARSLGSHTLVGCTVSPGFEFATFELAPPAWVPGAGPPHPPNR